MSIRRVSSGPADALFAQDSAATALLRQVDWKHTPLGPVERWPLSLRTALAMCLASSHPTLIIWGESRTIFYNDAFSALLGADHPAALGKPGMSLGAAWWHEIEPHIAAIINRGGASTCEFHPSTGGHPNGSTPPICSLTLQPLYDETGRAGAFATARAVEEQTHPEQPGISDTDNPKVLFEVIFDAVADAAFVYDRAGNIIRMNKAAQALFQLDKLPGYEQLSPDDRARLIAAQNDQGHRISADESGLARLLHGETLTGENALDVSLRLADGRRLEVNITGAPLTDANGAVTGAVALARDISEHRRAERQARWQAGLLEQSHDAIFIWELGGPILYWNRGAELLYGFSREEALGHVSHDLLQTRLPLPRSQFEAKLAHDHEWTGELMHITRHTQQVIVLSRLQVIAEPDGRTIVLEISHDITERKLLERAVREREARLNAILKLLPAGIALVDAHGSTMLVNEEAKSLWGEHVRLESAPPDSKLYPVRWPQAKPAAQIRSRLAHALATGNISLGDELEWDADDGARETILTSSAPIRDDAGSIIGAMAVMTDITERKRLERRASEALDALLMMAEELVRLPDADADEVTDSNRHLDQPDGDDHAVLRRILTLTQSLLGCRRAGIHLRERGTERFIPTEVVGIPKSMMKLWFSNDIDGEKLRASLPVAMREQFLAGEILVIDTKQPPFHGRSNPFDVRVMLLVPMRVGHELIGLVTLDFGAQDHVYTSEEKEFAATAARLAALAMERVHLMREREAARGQVLALEEINRRMNEFLGTASHELRTPLTSIQANVQIIERYLTRMLANVQGGHEGEALGAENIRDFLTSMTTLTDRTERQMFRLNRLIGDLLDATRIQADKLEYHTEPGDLVAITRDSVEEVRASWPERRILFHADNASVPVLCDADRIGQAVTNYLTNALKFSLPSQNVAVRVRAHGNQARVEVRDHGPGLNAAQQSRLFERFYRAPGMEQLSGSGVGLGLGLFIARTIIERHGGIVGVESAAEKGSTFWFTLPRREDDAAQPE